ncbi:sodium transporter [Neiella marina]|uniref:Sodium transporter n=1 Tax=Neiella holothuriorum TaxID=2870530 RepID=A0ABS7EL17_9GAMM|nr:sodium transporter [Neiella holothuriorum]MBW8192382.1 sodium transporter [Neiella holothuriorum]
MDVIDWWVIAIYLVLMLVGAWFIGRKQHSRDDYYLAGKSLPSWTLATSIVATQCSTNSLLGAPAFVGFVLGGGMLWLQYELAVPMAMLLLCIVFMPIRQAGIISIYEFLEQRLGLSCRLLASGCFLFFRGVATGVTIYGVASVISLVSGVSYTTAVILLMGITIAYDLMGGMKAVVISDVIQMVLLFGAVIIALFWLYEPLTTHYSALTHRTQTLVDDWGIQSGQHYGFWPMFFGGLFLYVAYYGCDQSQAQRLLSAKSPATTQTVLVLNGLIRFPLVLCYCFIGLGLAAYAIEHPNFVSQLPTTQAGSPNFNLVFPSFVSLEFAPGLAGLALVGLFAAAMSSIDSALNSLSASSVEDFIVRFRPLSEKRLFLLSKLTTLGWGVFAVLLSYQVERIAPTVLEAINKIGSLANGPLLGIFAIALFMPSLGSRAALLGFALALLSNIAIWLLLPTVSWLWWNLTGLACCLVFSLLIAKLMARPIRWQPMAFQLAPVKVALLILMTLLILAVNLWIQW